jgi:sulfite exporter TauE/SafE
MVYAALLLALSRGDALQGGLVMLAFGLGTLPNMLLISALASRLRQAARRRGLRLTVAGLLGAAGLYGVVHAVHPAVMNAAGIFAAWRPVN